MSIILRQKKSLKTSNTKPHILSYTYLIFENLKCFKMKMHTQVCYVEKNKRRAWKTIQLHFTIPVIKFENK